MRILATAVGLAVIGGLWPDQALGEPAKDEAPGRVSPWAPTARVAKEAAGAAPRVAGRSGKGRRVRRRGPPGSLLRVELLTMGPGTELYSVFGHGALRVTHLGGRGDVVFNFGTFDHHAGDVMRRFLQQRINYELSVGTYADTLDEYRQERRGMWAQELRLTPGQRLRLFRRLRFLARPENRAYRYDHFRRNCSTKIRDVLDWALGGALGRLTKRIPAHTFRYWLRRVTSPSPVFHLIFDLVVTDGDLPISLWDATFLPERLARAVELLRVPGPGGRSLPFVVRTRELLPGPPAAPPDGFPPWAAVVLIAWAMVGLTLLLLVIRPRGRLIRIWSGGLVALWGLVSTALGAVILFIWTMSTIPTFTNNWNVIIFPPTQLLLLYLGIRIAVQRPDRLRIPRWLGLYVWIHLALLAALALARLLGVVTQDNGPAIAVSVVITAVLAVCCSRITPLRSP